MIKSDIEIARSAKMKLIKDVLGKINVPDTPEAFSPMGRHIAKLNLEYIDKLSEKKSNLILVTAITPTPAGEGKTTTSVGLNDALNKIGKKSIVCLREPSLGPSFGMKGGAPGFSVENVFCLPGVPSILKSMLGGLKNKIVGGEPILSKTISLRTVESEIANSLNKVQQNNQDVEIGSYPFFQAGKLGVSIVLRSENQSKIDNCNSQILEFINKKKIEIVDR